MKIEVREVKDNLRLEFVRSFLGDLNLWIRDLDDYGRTVSRFCPHLNVAWFECVDCNKNFE